MSGVEHGESALGTAAVTLGVAFSCLKEVGEQPPSTGSRLILASSGGGQFCKMLYCFICGVELFLFCLHPETFLFTCLSFFSSSSSPDLYSEVSTRRAAPSHLLLCSSAPPFLPLQTPTVVSDQLPRLQPRSPASIARMPPWEPHTHCRLCA